jgi:hypothetical protein
MMRGPAGASCVPQAQAGGIREAVERALEEAWEEAKWDLCPECGCREGRGVPGGGRV